MHSHLPHEAFCKCYEGITCIRQDLPIEAVGIDLIALVSSKVLELRRIRCVNWKRLEIQLRNYPREGVCIFMHAAGQHYQVPCSGIEISRHNRLVFDRFTLTVGILSVEEIPTMALACSAAFCRIGAAFPSLSPRIAAILLTSLSMMASAANSASSANERRDLVSYLSRQVPISSVGKIRCLNILKLPLFESQIICVLEKSINVCSSTFAKKIHSHS